MKIIYNKPEDATEYSEDKFYESLNKYGQVSREKIREAVNAISFDPCHVSVLIETGVKLLPDENSARKYWEDHKRDDGVGFERLRRITGQAN